MPGKNYNRGGRGGKGGNRGGKRQGGNWGERSNAQDVHRHNEKFEKYYNELDIIPEDKRPAFWAAMRSDLPNSFRFAGSRGHALVVQRRLIDHFIPKITSLKYEGEDVTPPTPIDWYPDRLAWSMSTPKNVIRKHPPFASFQKFLVSENSVGNITRQEIVSMIPPLFMDIEPGMSVLDLCAAPGSKSAQLIEMVHGGEEARVRKVLEQEAKRQGRQLSPSGDEVKLEQDLVEQENDFEDDGRPTGFLIANDKEYRRAQMLVHQCKRLNSPNIIVTNHDATLFPSLKVSGDGRDRYLKFDRILADVPCSGDGTARKNYDIWRTWTQGNGLGLHNTQIRILVRALQMLKVGGRVVYSTCSLNPIENEAVVAGAIDRCGGSEKVILMDTSGYLPGLKREQGLHKWRVVDKAGDSWSSWSEYAEADKDSERLGKINETMFPPRPEHEIPLHRCTRIYPHLQDTGGFFVAVLEKRTEIKAKPESGSHTALPNPAKASTSSAPISAMVAEINGQSDEQFKSGAKIEAADVIAPLQEALPDPGNAPAAARQNQPNNPGEVEENGPASQKRKLEIESDTGAGAKHMRLREEIEEPAPGAPERQVHFPPPPSAALNLHPTSHDTVPTSSNIKLGDFAPGKKVTSLQPMEEAFKYLDPHHPELQSIYDFYELSPRFPRDRFLVRNPSGQPVKAIYYSTAAVRDILQLNEGKGIKFVHSGIKMFVKQDTQGDPKACKWRIQTEGLGVLESWAGEARMVRLTEREVLRKLLIELFPRITDTGYLALGAIGERMRDMPKGCCVLRIEPDGTQTGFQERLVMPLWRGVSSVNLMLPKEERKAMLLRMFDDDSKLIDQNVELQERRERVKAEEGETSSMTLQEDTDDSDKVDIGTNGVGAKEAT